MNGLTDAEWDEYLKQVNAYGLDEYLSIYQKYLDEFYK
jgi:putative aldouronate transport system substrate-binding protein